LRASVQQWSDAALNYPRHHWRPQSIQIKGARTELQVGNSLYGFPNIRTLTVTNLNDQILQLGLQAGTLRLSVYQLPSGGTIEVDTPNAP